MGYLRLKEQRLLQKNNSMVSLWCAVTQNPGKGFRTLKPEQSIHLISKALAPSSPKIKRMIEQLRLDFTKAEIAGIICYNPIALEALMSSARPVPVTVRKLIWMFWSLCYKPDNLRDALCILTWGTLYRTKPGEAKPYKLKLKKKHDNQAVEPQDGSGFDI